MATLPQIQIPGNIPEPIRVALQAIKENLESRAGQIGVVDDDAFLTRKLFYAPPVWQEPVLVNSWVNYGTVVNNAGYTKDKFGMVRLRGVIKTGTIPASAFILPDGYRPVNTHIFAVISNDTIGRVDIDANGEVKIAVGSNVYVSLDNISFLPA